MIPIWIIGVVVAVGILWFIGVFVRMMERGELNGQD